MRALALSPMVRGVERAGPLDALLSSRIAIGVACAAFVAVLFAGNASTPLFDQDEGAYAGFARTMLETGDFASNFRMPSLASYLGRKGISYRERRDGERLDAVYASEAPQLLVFRKPGSFERFLADRPDADAIRARSRHADGWRVDKLESIRFWRVPGWRGPHDPPCAGSGASRQ